MHSIVVNNNSICSQTNFTKICRICKSERSNLLNLFANDDVDEPSLGEKFLACTSLDLHEADCLPQNICYGCAKALEYTHNFRKICRQSDSEFRQFLDSIKQIKQEKDDSDMEDVCEEIEILEDEQNEETMDSVSYTEESPPSNLEDSTIKYEIDDEIILKDTTNEEKPFKCDRCNASYYTAKALQLHNKLEENKLLKQRKERKEERTTKDSDDISKGPKYYCQKCNESFESLEDLNLHDMENHVPENEICNICDKSYSPKTIKSHMLSHQCNTEHVCSICFKVFSEPKYLSRHMLYHQTMIYKCTETNCGRDFNVKHKLVQHLRRYHSKALTRADVKQLIGVAPDEMNDEDIEIID